MNSFFDLILNFKRPPNFSNLHQTLSQEISSFVQLHETSKDRMERIVEDIHDFAKKVEDIMKQTKIKMVKGIVAVITGYCFSALCAVVCKDLSVVFFGIFCFWAGISALCFFIKHKIEEHAHVTKMNRLTEQFCLTFKPLKDSLEYIKSSCGSLRRNSSGAEVLRFTRLEMNILELFFIVARLRSITSLHSILQQAEKVKKVSDGFIRVKNDLQKFYQH